MGGEGSESLATRLFDGLEAPLAPLDRLPRGLWLGGLTHSQGQAAPRLAALEHWRAALLRGEGDPGHEAAHWPPPPVSALLVDALARLKLPAYCADRPEMADTVLQGLLFHLDLIVDYRDRGATAAAAEAMAIDAFAADWTERCGEIDEFVGVFGDLGELLKHTRWDTLRGLLRSGAWQEVVRIRKLVERLPELARVIRGLGRARESEDKSTTSQAMQTVIEPATALRTEARSVRVPHLPGETRGVHRSGRIARMLPVEAMLLGHPQLRLVWHARHAERTLLAYEDDDCLREERQRPMRVQRPSLRPAPGKRLEMGPMLLCVDTSGSMQGGAEAVAKAVVLEAVRSAHAQGRACHVFAFGGTDEVVDMGLAVDAEGVARLAGFLAQGFRGGTDICGPVERALARLEEGDWQRADLLIASDGEFGATAALAQRVRDARAGRGLRVQGILIGDRETIGLLELADDIFWVRDWRRYGRATAADGGATEAASPVHASTLTATYFPGALRSVENRERTLKGEAAAAAVRAGAHRGAQPGAGREPDISPGPAPDRDD